MTEHKQPLQSKSYCFTLNNPSQPRDDVYLEDFFHNKCHYLLYQTEEGKNNTTHFQGFFQLKTRLRITQLKKFKPLDRAHLEVARGTPSENIAYCTKPGGRDKKEFGSVADLTSAGSRSDIKNIANTIVNGNMSSAQFALAQPEAYLKYHGGIDRLIWHRDSTFRKNRKLKVFLFLGPPGTGKTHTALRQFPNAFKLDVAGSNVWFDGYSGEKELIIDEFNGQIKYSFFLQIIDKYPLTLPVKCAHTVARWTTVVITANSGIDEWYPINSDKVNALRRRITKIVYFNHVYYPHSLNPPTIHFDSSKDDIKSLLDDGPLDSYLEPIQDNSLDEVWAQLESKEEKDEKETKCSSPLTIDTSLPPTIVLSPRPSRIDHRRYFPNKPPKKTKKTRTKKARRRSPSPSSPIIVPSPPPPSPPPNQLQGIDPIDLE